MSPRRSATTSPNDERFDRILVIVTRQIGDVLLTTPLIRAARVRWPAAAIDVLGFAGTLSMLDGNADVAGRVEVDPGRGWRGALADIRRLWRRYDLALVAQESDRAHLYGWVAARVRSGIVPTRSATAWWKRRLLRHAVPIAGDRGAVHAVTEKLGLLAPWTDGPAEAEPVAPASKPLPPALAALVGGHCVVVQVPSMWRYKQWPVACYRAVVEALLADGWQVVLSGGPSAADRAKTAEVAACGKPPRLIDACGQLDFGQLAGLLRGAALYLGPDTSVTHLAAACGVAVIALFGPSNPMRWAPWPAGRQAPPPYERRNPRQHNGRVLLLQGEAACPPGVPCGRAGCADHHASPSICLEVGLSWQRVLAEARAVLASAGAPANDQAQR